MNCLNSHPSTNDTCPHRTHFGEKEKNRKSRGLGSFVSFRLYVHMCVKFRRSLSCQFNLYFEQRYVLEKRVHCDYVKKGIGR